MARSELGSVNSISDGGAMVNAAAFELPSGFETVIDAGPGDRISVNGTAALNCPDETNIVGRVRPFQWTVELVTKLLPLTFKVKLFPPASIPPGCSAFITGNGGLMVKVELAEVPPGPETATDAVPGPSISAVEIVADN